eukprot:UN28301
MQQVTYYLPKEDNYCVRAIYNTEKKTVPFFDGRVISVFNYANADKVNGKNVNDDNQILCARLPNESEPAKLLVAPCFLPNQFLKNADYWIVAAGPSSDNYEWAIISGGEATTPAEDGLCTNDYGFWF